VSATLVRWNDMALSDAAEEILPCCGSRRWAHALARLRPLLEVEVLFEKSDEIWRQLAPTDWDEAFSCHPRIGETKEHDTTTWSRWSSQEQSGVDPSRQDIRDQLRDANRRYEERFGRIYIVCATGKSAEEMLAMLYRRLENDDGTELNEAADQQRLITQLRLRKWLGL